MWTGWDHSSYLESLYIKSDICQCLKWFCLVKVIMACTVTEQHSVSILPVKEDNLVPWLACCCCCCCCCFCCCNLLLQLAACKKTEKVSQADWAGSHIIREERHHISLKISHWFTRLNEYNEYYNLGKFHQLYHFHTSQSPASQDTLIWFDDQMIKW